MEQELTMKYFHVYTSSILHHVLVGADSHFLAAF
jgi:hypothetical protein